MGIIKRLFGRGKTTAAPVAREKSLVEHFKGLKNASDVLAQLKEPFDRGAAMRHVFQRTISDVKATVCHVQGGVASFTTGGSVWAFDAATQTPIFRKEVDNENVSSIDQYKAFSNTNPNIPDEIYAFYARGFITWTTCAQFAQHEIINRACAVRGEDAVAVGYELAYADAEEGGKVSDKNGDGKISDAEKNTRNDFLTALMRQSKRMGIDEVLRKLDYNKCVYGIGIAVPCFDGEVDMSLPFNIDARGLETYTGFTVIEPYWLCPMFDDKDSSDPSSKHFFDPTWWRLPNGKIIHRSWCVKCVNSHVADILKPTYIYGGIPLTQMIYERVFAADKCANEAPMLALTKRLLVVDANVQQVLADPKHVKDLMDVVTYCRTNWGVMFKQPGADISQIDTSLGEYDQLIMTQYQLVASIAQMPATKLLKVTPTGFQSTGEYEWKDWAQSLIDIQEMEFTPLLERHFQLLTRKRGKLVAVSVKWNAVDAPTGKEKADIQSVKCSSYSQLVSAGIVTPEEVRDILRNDKDGEFTALPLESPKKDADIMAQLAEKMGGDASPSKDEEESVSTHDKKEFEETKHPRDTYGKFSKNPGKGLTHKLLEYAKKNGKQLFDKDGKHIYSKEATEFKPFVFPKKSQSEKQAARKLTKASAAHYNGGNREVDLSCWRKNAKSVPYSGNHFLSDYKKKDLITRGKPKCAKGEMPAKGKPQFSWSVGGRALSDKEAFELEHALVNGGYGKALIRSNHDVMIRPDYANGRGQVMTCTTSTGTTSYELDPKAQRYNKERHLDHINSVFENAEKICNALDKDISERDDDDFAVLAYFQLYTTFRVGSSKKNMNGGAMQIKKSDVSITGDSVVIDMDCKNAHWHTRIDNPFLAEWFRFNAERMDENETFFGTTKYSEYCDYLSELGERCGVKAVTKSNGKKKIGLGSHDLRRMSASLFASHLVDQIKINPKKDPEGYIKAIEDVVTKTARHINDKDATIPFKSYIATAALWKNAMWLYESDDRFIPPTGR